MRAVRLPALVDDLSVHYPLVGVLTLSTGIPTGNRCARLLRWPPKRPRGNHSLITDYSTGFHFARAVRTLVALLTTMKHVGLAGFPCPWFPKAKG